MHWHGQCHMEIGMGGLKRRLVGWIWAGKLGWDDCKKKQNKKKK